MKKHIQKMDLLLLLSSIILTIIGVVAIYSASSVVTVLSQGVASNYYLKKQVLIVLAASAFSTLFILLFKYRLYKNKLIIYFLTIFIIVSLIGLKYYGMVVNGSRSWYDLGLFSFQPSEFAKTILILFMAYYYERLIKIKEYRWYLYFIPFLVAIIMAFLIFKQPDLGGAIIIALLVLLTFVSVPINKFVKKKCSSIIWITIVIGLVLVALVGPKLISEYQRNRLNFLAPCTRYTEPTGYQVCNSEIAIKNGGLTGLGFGNSTQKYLYLPEAHTDFIFPIICEEMGIIGGIIVLLLYIAMLYSILRIAKGASKVSDSIIAYGTFIYLTIHILINLLGVLALMPLTGVPLPLLSYGGSFNINVIVLLFVCQRIAIDSKNAKITEKIKKL
ncbi:MAG: FtsW/RodA/SpoVE family cell cycle protein [Bacilli bacterium]|nr:FtsW/RodA/SpoVE family cell cycle protein [Bacilli bacterium]